MEEENMVICLSLSRGCGGGGGSFEVADNSGGEDAAGSRPGKSSTSRQKTTAWHRAG